MRQLLLTVFLFLGVSSCLFADNPHVLNPSGCVDPNEVVMDTCPVLEQVSCPNGPCISNILVFGCEFAAPNPSVWEAIEPGPGGSFENPKRLDEYGLASYEVDFKLCYTKRHCRCKLDDNGDPVCITSTIARDYVIKKWEVISNVSCLLN